MRIADGRAQHRKKVRHGVILAERDTPAGQEVTMRAPLVIAALMVTGLSLGAAPLAHAADTKPASGTFTFVTANGVLPTWSIDGLVIIGVRPGSVDTTLLNTRATVALPVVARTGSAVAAAGGFRINSIVSNASFRCSSPTIDIRANVVDCVLINGTNASLFAITSPGKRSRVSGASTVTDFYKGMSLRLNGQRMADMLNTALGVSTFSPSVTIATSDLVVTQNR
jgi:hypothetical protein